MTMISATCRVTIPVAAFDPAVVTRAIEALSFGGALPRILLAGAERSVLPSLVGGPVGATWFEGSLQELLAWRECVSESGLWVAVPTDLPGDTPESTITALSEALRMPILAEKGEPRADLWFDANGRLTGLRELVSDGPTLCADGSLAGSSVPVWEAGGLEPLRAYALDASELTWPSRAVRPTSGGDEVVRIFRGGAMAIGCQLETDNASSALGFREEHELAAWIAVVRDRHPAALPLSPFEGALRNGARKDATAAHLRLAAQLLAGRVDVDSPSSPWSEDDEPKPRLAAAEVAFAMACLLIAASHAPKPKKIAAARALAFLGPEGRRQLKRLASPELVEALRSFGIDVSEQSRVAEAMCKARGARKARDVAKAGARAQGLDDLAKLLCKKIASVDGAPSGPGPAS